MHRRMHLSMLRAFLIGSIVVAAPALAQQSAAPRSPGPAASQPAAKKSTHPAPEGPGGEAGLQHRINQLEEQLMDLQVVIGTLESLARTGAATGSTGAFRGGAAAGAGDSERVDSVEIQVRALVQQVERLADRVRALETGGRAAAPSPLVEPGRDTAAARMPSSLSPTQRPAPESGFGRTTVMQGGGDPIGGLLREGDDGAARPNAGRQAALTDPVANPKQSYESAYGYLLQQDYGAAEAAFTEFLSNYPNDPLAGNAQYWLGETYFVRGQFKAAASAFLKGYQTYARGTKAADSLLKLAMSLDRLGQKDAACSSYAELASKFPNSPPQIRSRAQSERQRLGC